ncbi:TorC Nitrate/TMAO reductases, membrane-bound tetraheme cytochrome c subunit [Methylophilaceae bacterium]
MQEQSKSDLGKRSKSWFIGIGIGLILLAGGLVFAAGKAAIDKTNTLEFCISCHEMKDNNFEEYKTTIHAKNRTGVKAICSDCHVPHGFVDTAKRKVMAVNDIYHHLIGTEDTKEKFEAHRLVLAKKVWKHMKETDSAECRNCHDVKTMDPEQQGPTARKQHQKIGVNGKTCIDCHYGIAHHEPKGGLEPSDALN